MKGGSRYAVHPQARKGARDGTVLAGGTGSGEVRGVERSRRAGEGSRGADEQEWPTSVIVIDMRPDQADDPDFIEAVRRLVMDRTIERRRLMLDYIFEFGDEMPEPRGGEPREGEEPNEADEAEARLRSHLMEREGQGGRRGRGRLPGRGPGRLPPLSGGANLAGGYLSRV